ncbi:hypothetical protein [Pantanalinema sp. GBBB05]|uniref:hypothetical protein n=1 Tax=Pantanalinema sp. GBBB05 TaxID=2604139 RepID=UPI001D9073C6|nr:hypothetical protein [Pantanalinema sp. GBBB05]
MSNLAIVSDNRNALFAVNYTEAKGIIEKVIAENGDLSRLTAVERKVYYLAMCDRYGLDPFSNPFDYLEGKGKSLKLYPNKRAAEAFGLKHNLSYKITEKSVSDGVAMVTVTVTDGRRSTEDIGVVEINGYINRADALKKAVSQARRRAILAWCGFSPESDRENTISAEALDPPVDIISAVPVTVHPEPEPFNREPYYAAIESDMKRLGWKKSTAVDFLKHSYQKATRDELTGEELIDFVEFLARQPDPVPAS